jgi:argininosuccinate lyase
MKLWGGRFSEDLNALAAALNNSLPFDRRLAQEDVRGSLAWSQAICQAGILTTEEMQQIHTGLHQILAEIEHETFEFHPGDEDIHAAVERRLKELKGPVAEKLHTGRSRNDQVATDFRLWMLEAIDQVTAALQTAQHALTDRASADMGIVIPGYTHLQRAQPILLSHWWLSHFWPLQRDAERLSDLRRRAAVLPLGSGALAGVPFAVDRVALAADLGFDHPAPNSLDAVSDRDFVAEFLFCAALIGVHLSRLSEMLILFSTAEFGFVELADAYTTGSSLMPQKKNPDTLELARGSAGTLIGQLTGLLAVLKSLPSAYDKDLQEDKQPVFKAADLLLLLLPVTAGVLDTLSVRPQAIQAALSPALLATDLADYLVLHGVPFRSAHEIVGKVVLTAKNQNVEIDRLTLEDLQAISPVFESDVAQVFDFQASVERRAAIGGTATAAVQTQLQQAIGLLEG